MTGKGHCHPSMETCSSAVHGFCGEAPRKDDHKNKTWWSLSRVNNYPPCARQDEQGKAVALRPQFWGKEYGNNHVLVCLSVNVINIITKNKL